MFCGMTLKDQAGTIENFFILSKGHGCAALYVVLEKFKFIKRHDIVKYSTSGGILGGHLILQSFLEWRQVRVLWDTVFLLSRFSFGYKN